MWRMLIPRLRTRGGFVLCLVMALALAMGSARTTAQPLQLRHPATVSRADGGPVITCVNGITLAQTQIIDIRGHGFGNHEPYQNRDVDTLELLDVTGDWSAGYAGDAVTLNVSKWVDNEIVVGGFAGAWGGGWTIKPSDKFRVSVWNAQTGQGPAVYNLQTGPKKSCAARSVATPALQLRIVFPTVRPGAKETLGVSTGPHAYLTIVITYSADAAPPRVVGPVRANEDGNFGFSWRVPANVHGAVAVTVVGNRVVRGTFTIK